MVKTLMTIGRWLGIVRERRLLTKLDRDRILAMIDGGISQTRLVEYFGYTSEEVEEATASIGKRPIPSGN